MTKEHYEYIYNNQNKYGQYGHDNHSRDHMCLFKELDASSVVDIGCGHNEFIKGLDVSKRIGVDIACPSADVKASADNLPFDEKEFDVLTSFDCLEHLDAHLVDASLIEMKRVSCRLFVTVCFKKETCYRVDDETLHPSAHNQPWWKKKLEEYAELTDVHIYSEGSQGDHALYIGVWK